MTAHTVTIPGLRTVSEANSHTHWRERQKRARHQRGTVILLLQSQIGRRAIPAGPGCLLDVTFTRFAPSNGLDDDNLTGAMKHVRDGAADFLGLTSDRDPRVAWHYRQARGPWAVRIDIAPRASEPADGPELHLELSADEIAALEAAFARNDGAAVLLRAGETTVKLTRRPS